MSTLFDIEPKVESPYLYQDGLFDIENFCGWAVLLTEISENKHRLHIVNCLFNKDDLKKEFLTADEIHFYFRLDGAKTEMLNKFKRVTNILSSSSEVPGDYTEFHGSKEERYNAFWE